MFGFKKNRPLIIYLSLKTIEYENDFKFGTDIHIYT